MGGKPLPRVMINYEIQKDNNTDRHDNGANIMGEIDPVGNKRKNDMSRDKCSNRQRKIRKDNIRDSESNVNIGGMHKT